MPLPLRVQFLFEIDLGAFSNFCDFNITRHFICCMKAKTAAATRNKPTSGSQSGSMTMMVTQLPRINVLALTLAVLPLPHTQ